ncbi:52 kDa repressor of the inhibitor of the protein kinase [Dissostichus eleginoides]|uniref:52 kDa repressor of the inhibitor of the protein kinase n=1 Tax=Dissostichus eleginoides TaxID=100907 RepID=A0AAD9F6E2_DISEL|nr:52 kDa repressor of the inhibitor of the protein kinase [Dissostichus eleginoides]
MLYKFFSGSVVHDLFMKKQKELEPTAQCVELKKLSDTRWACQYNAIWAVKKTLPTILATLRDIIGLSNPHRRTEARALSAIMDETFVVHLIIFEDVFRTTKFMSDQLQSATFDLEAADDLAQSVTTAISEKRTEDKWREIRNEAESLCVNAGIAPQMQHRLLMEMKRRFSTETNEVLRGVSALSPKHTSFLDKKMILPMARHYRIMSCERSFSCLRRLKNYLRNTSGDSRTSNLALLAINTVRTRALDSDKIIDAFALNHNNRRIVFL